MLIIQIVLHRKIILCEITKLLKIQQVKNQKFISEEGNSHNQASEGDHMWFWSNHEHPFLDNDLEDKTNRCHIRRKSIIRPSNQADFISETKTNISTDKLMIV